MQKIPTVFVRDQNDRRYVTNVVTEGCEWVFTDPLAIPTRKYDGTCVMLDDDGRWWARREVKPGKAAPHGFVEAAFDDATGKTVGWEPAEQSAFWKYLNEAVQAEAWNGRGSVPGGWQPGTYELLGPKINGNPEATERHYLLRHAGATELGWVGSTFEELRGWLAGCGFEGIVWHHPDGRMAKLKARDFPRESE